MLFVVVVAFLRNRQTDIDRNTETETPRETGSERDRDRETQRERLYCSSLGTCRLLC